MDGEEEEVIMNVYEDETSSEKEVMELESEDDVENDETKEDNATVLDVGNIPISTTKEEMETLFKPYGKAQVKKMHHKEEDSVCWSVTYDSLDNATKAISGLHLNHIMSGGRLPITVVLQTKRAAVPLKECFEKLKRYTMNFKPDLAENVDDQQKLCESMKMAIGYGGADALISLTKQVAKDGRPGEHRDSIADDLELGLGSLSRDDIANLIMEPLDGKPIKKKTS